MQSFHITAPNQFQIKHSRSNCQTNQQSMNSISSKKQEDEPQAKPQRDNSFNLNLMEQTKSDNRKQSHSPY